MFITTIASGCAHSLRACLLVPVKWCCFPLVRHRILGVVGWQIEKADVLGRLRRNVSPPAASAGFEL